MGPAQRCIKADNGVPLGDPQRMSVPVLSKLVFVRKVNNTGTFNFFNQKVYAALSHKGKTLSLHFDLPHQHFNISDDKGHIIASLQADNFSAEHILKLTVSTYR